MVALINQRIGKNAIALLVLQLLHGPGGGPGGHRQTNFKFSAKGEEKKKWPCS